MFMPWYLGSIGFLQSSIRSWMQIGIIPLLVWSLVWKGTALWHAARRNDRVWFAMLLIINTVGILEIVYLLFVVRLFACSARLPARKYVSKRKRK
ncbi:MAG: hypothetical protein UV63_C0019G0046 [Microgenomates group bacterium GW2011_GWC1_43_11]|nr:MAG: hypothetical protein UV63_C0019G0046 [Microgenomates group bacterium GW2011_GWC1_43_11]